MERLLDPVKKNTKEYLMSTVMPKLIQGLTEMTIERPSNPHGWLARFLLAQAPEPEPDLQLPTEDKISLRLSWKSEISEIFFSPQEFEHLIHVNVNEAPLQDASNALVSLLKDTNQDLEYKPSSKRNIPEESVSPHAKFQVEAASPIETPLEMPSATHSKLKPNEPNPSIGSSLFRTAKRISSDPIHFVQIAIFGSNTQEKNSEPWSQWDASRAQLPWYVKVMGVGHASEIFSPTGNSLTVTSTDLENIPIDKSNGELNWMVYCRWIAQHLQLDNDIGTGKRICLSFTAKVTPKAKSKKALPTGSIRKGHKIYFGCHFFFSSPYPFLLSSVPFVTSILLLLFFLPPANLIILASFY